ncbi:MAG: hydrogenase expression/formation protein HypE [Planctomycetota bacterium]|nr:hydrogenase expression/formation protein HypE [Planctomycetota bacterium]
MSETERPDPSAFSCPAPLSNLSEVQLGHGGGGRLSKTLVEELFVAAFDNPHLNMLHDGAVLDLGGKRLAFSTDSFVVHPHVFPGGDIGSMAVHGTVNDLAMCGADPLGLSAAFILEEGFAMEALVRITASLREAAKAAGVHVVTGDTKVVDRGKGDGVYINTSGVGLIPDGIDLAPQRAQAGDVVILSGEIAAHGIAVLSVREGLSFETDLVSDSAPLNGLTRRVLDAGGADVHVLRDPTRGGVASALTEIATAAGVGVKLDERAIPLDDGVRGACELLGLDPLYVANEGKCIAIVAPEVADAALAAMRADPLGAKAAIVGEVVEDHAGEVRARSTIGGERIVDMLSGEQLPRIC